MVAQRATTPAPSGIEAATGAVLASLAHRGLLLKQDRGLPSVVTLLAGEPLASSWWSHPQARLIFRVLAALADHPDVLVTKLLYGKDTFVHRALWPALLAVAGGTASWQTEGLSASARNLLARVRRARAPLPASGVPARELLVHLLVHSAEVHTASGRHILALQSWAAWAAQAQVAAEGPLARARSRLERVSRELGAQPGALPWTAPRTAGRTSCAQRPACARRAPRR